SQVLLPSSYELMYKIGWLDSYAAIIVPGAVSVFGMFLFMQAMKTVPDELLQAGRVDGCSELRLWWEVALPIVRPMIGAYTLLSFMGAWNSFLWPQIVLQSQNKYTLPVGLTNMLGLPEYQTPYGVLMTGTFLSIVPVAILFFILQRDFITGLASGAVKGWGFFTSISIPCDPTTSAATAITATLRRTSTASRATACGMKTTTSPTPRAFPAAPRCA